MTNVVVRVGQPCDGGRVVVEMGVAWPSDATWDDVMAVVAQAIGKFSLEAQRKGLPTPPDWVPGPEIPR